MQIKGRLPFGDVSENRRMSANIMPPLQDSISGEIVAAQTGRPMGAAHMAGRVTDFYISARNAGRDDDNHISLSGELKINGTSCLTTQPSIGYTSGEAGQQKTTRITGDTGVTQAVINDSANSLSAGDVLTWDLLVQSQASPDEKITDVVAVVVFEPESD